MDTSLSAHTKALLVGACILVVFGSGYLVGHRSTPAVVQTKDKVEETKKGTETAKTKVDTKKAVDRVVDKDVSTDKVTTKFPDGRVVVEEKKVDKTKTDTKATETKIVTKEVVKTVEVVRIETHEKLVLRRSDWLLGVYGGVSPSGLLGGSTEKSFVPGLPNVATVGLSLEKRLFGNVYGGVHLDNHGRVMLGLSIAF